MSANAARRRALVAATVTFLCVMASRALPAQGSGNCTFVCSPSMTFKLGGITSHVFSSPRVQNLSTDRISRIPSTTNTELFLVAAAKTAIPRTSLFLSVQWLPTATIARNPYTEYTASEIGDQSIRGNSPSFTLGLSATAVKAAQLAGFASLAVYAGDLFSTAARPDDGSAYTHKLDAGLQVSLMPFARASQPSSWVRGVNVFVLLDDVLTGLPRKGDEVPHGSRLFLDNAHAVSLIYGVALPISQ